MGQNWLELYRAFYQNESFVVVYDLRTTGLLRRGLHPN
jgi:hypothetical protein